MEQERTKSNEDGFSVDGSVKGLLTRLGDALDSFTGRSWKPAGGLTASHLTERFKELVDRRVRDAGKGRRVAPNILRVKIDWERFSADSDSLISKLEQDILVAIVDHYNDRRYHTLGPLSLKIKTDYFTDGVRMSASFPAESVTESEIELEMPEELKARPQTVRSREIPPVKINRRDENPMFHLVLRETSHDGLQSRFDFEIGRRISIGRTPGNDVVLEEASVSSSHASAILNPDGKLMIADLGSRNGTFIGEERLGEGIGTLIESGTEIRFGNVSLVIEYDSPHAGGSR